MNYARRPSGCLSICLRLCVPSYGDSDFSRMAVSSSAHATIPSCVTLDHCRSSLIQRRHHGKNEYVAVSAERPGRRAL